MIEAVVAFWVVVFMVKSLLAKGNKEVVHSLFIALLFTAFYLYFRLDKDDLLFFIRIIMIFGLTLGTFFLSVRRRSID